VTLRHGMLAVGLSALMLAPGAAPQAAPAKPPALLLGTAWYPEQWPESRWDDDLKLMQAAGIHGAGGRIRLEPHGARRRPLRP